MQQRKARLLPGSGQNEQTDPACFSFGGGTCRGGGGKKKYLYTYTLRGIDVQRVGPVRPRPARAGSPTDTGRALGPWPGPWVILSARGPLGPLIHGPGHSPPVVSNFKITVSTGNAGFTGQRTGPHADCGPRKRPMARPATGPGRP
jgi:hypothetical protein